MANELRNKRVAVLGENGFEQLELTEPKKALENAARPSRSCRRRRRR
jgi:putative intracellular protease/amidase